MTVLCTYVLTKDTGLAPNPFWGWCTLAVCTPNRQRARLAKGDWIAGFSSKSDGNRLIYAMQVVERIHMDDYFRDSRFANKKPNMFGNWKKRCGDNFYSLTTDGTWKQHKNSFHGPVYLKKDTRNPYVFVAKRFWYFGREAVPIPDKFVPLVGTRGIRVNHPPSLIQAFLNWLQSKCEPGIKGLPTHNADADAEALDRCGLRHAKC